MCFLVASKDCDLDIPIQSRADGSVFNLRQLQVRTKTIPSSRSSIRRWLRTEPLVECEQGLTLYKMLNNSAIDYEPRQPVLVLQ